MNTEKELELELMDLQAEVKTLKNENQILKDELLESNIKFRVLFFQAEKVGWDITQETIALKIENQKIKHELHELTHKYRIV